MRITALGTSLTQKGRWPKDLERALNAARVAAQVAVIAKSGGTTPWALEQISAVIASKPDHLLVELYANDASLINLISTEESGHNLGKILSEVRKALPKTKIALMAMNPFLGVKGALRPFLGAYIAEHNRVAKPYAADFIDFRPLWQRLVEGALARSIPDGSHPVPEVASGIMTPILLAHFRKIAQV